MDTIAHHRHDISDELWARIESIFPDSKGKRGRPARDNRSFFNAVLWIMRSGAPWRAPPPDYGHWNSVVVRFRRLAKAGFWTNLTKLFTNFPDFVCSMPVTSRFTNMAWELLGEQRTQGGPPKRGDILRLNLYRNNLIGLVD